MSWLAVLLIGLALADLTHSVRPVRILPEAVGAAGAVVVGLFAGLTEPRDVAALRPDRARGHRLGPDRDQRLRRPAARLGAAGGARGLGGPRHRLRRSGRRRGRAGGGLAPRDADPPAPGHGRRSGAVGGRRVRRTAQHRQRRGAAGAGRDRHRQPGPARPGRRPGDAAQGWPAARPDGARLHPRPRALRPGHRGQHRRRREGVAALPRAVVAARPGADPPADGILPRRQLRLAGWSR